MTDLYSKIVSTGSYLPQKIYTNHDIEKLVDTSHDWIVERTGIISRHIADENESSVDMAYEASCKALERSNLKNNDIDLYNFCFHPKYTNLMFVGLLQPLGCIWPLSDLQSQQIVKYLKNEWNYPKNFEQAVIKQQNNMPYDFIDTPRHKLEVDFHTFRKHLENEIN